MERSRPAEAGTTTSSPAAPRPAAESDWTTRRLLSWMHEYFTTKDVDSPRVLSEMLLCHVLGCERMRLYMDADRPSSPEELATLRDLVRRAGQHEPVQHILGEDWFFTRPFAVNTSTLIPRPETESLVEYVLQWCHQQTRRDEDVESASDPEPATTGDIEVHPIDPTFEADGEQDVTEVEIEVQVEESHPMIDEAPIETPPLRIADVGTGTGCIAISLAAQLPHATIIATDIVPEALDLARSNAERHGVADRIAFELGDGLGPLQRSEPVDIFCSNPPYVPDHEWDDIKPNVKDYEPETALRGGADGLDIIRPMIAGLSACVKPGGLIAIEIASCQRDAVIDLAESTGAFEQVRVVKDLHGKPRILLAQRRASTPE